MITLRSSDGEIFEVDEAVAMEMKTIEHMMEDGCADSTIPVPNVTGHIFAKVIEYCKKHATKAKAKEEQAAGTSAVNDDIKTWDADFVNVDQATLFDLIMVRHPDLILFFFFIHIFINVVFLGFFSSTF